jgi:hypothetical protein
MQGQEQTRESTYNYNHFHPSTLAEDAKLIRDPEGPHPGDPAPDFTLKDTDGKEWRLHDLGGKPVVLITGSGTCPITQGSLPGMKSLYADYSHDCQWLMLYVREAHPGENMPGHKTHEQKREQAEFFRNETGTPWPILIDELDGRTHIDYGLLPNSVFLIDADGKVSFVGEITHAPTLRTALEQLFEQNMRGPVDNPEDKTPHMLGPTAYGWEALERGGHVSTRDVTRRMPPLAGNLWMGDKAQPLLDPLARRSEPLSTGNKIFLASMAGLRFSVWCGGCSRSTRSSTIPEGVASKRCSPSGAISSFSFPLPGVL